MENSLENIKIGDKVIIKGLFYSNSSYVAEVTKVNKTTFVAGNFTFRKQNGSQYGGDTWNKMYASFATEEDIAKVTAEAERRKMVRFLRDTDFSKLSDEDLKKVYDIIRNN